MTEAEKARADRRLEIARRLIRPRPEGDMRTVIMAMTEEKRSYLRGIVDWLEDYERGEAVYG